MHGLVIPMHRGLNPFSLIEDAVEKDHFIKAGEHFAGGLKSEMLSSLPNWASKIGLRENIAGKF